MPSYELAQQQLGKLLNEKELLGLRHPIAGSIAGLFGSLVKVPVDVVKKRVQAGIYPNVLQAIKSIASEGSSSKIAYRASSVSNFYAGWRSSMLYDVPYNAVQFTVLESVKRAVHTIKRKRTLGQAEHVVVGALTGMITSVITEPVRCITLNIT